MAPKSLLSAVKQHFPLSVKGEEALAAIAIREEQRAGQLLVKQGEPCENIYFLESGYVRGFRYQEKEEVTFWLARTDAFFTSFHSFFSCKPSLENVETLNRCVVWKITRDNLHKLYDQYPEIERAGRIITEHYYIQLEERVFASHFKSAKERYEQLLQTAPGILQDVPLGIIASYLGITQETLSRIRKMK